jgi:Spy/CpxP family protein refolding chaperone
VQSFARLLLVAVLLTLAAAPASAQGGKWWLSSEMQQRLRLTPAQVTSIDTMYQSSLPDRQALRAMVACLQSEVQQLLARPTVDDAEAYRLISRLADTQARGNIARTRLLLAIRRQLTPDQRAVLARLHPLH